MACCIVYHTGPALLFSANTLFHLCGPAGPILIIIRITRGTLLVGTALNFPTRDKSQQPCNPVQTDPIGGDQFSDAPQDVNINGRIASMTGLYPVWYNEMRRFIFSQGRDGDTQHFGCNSNRVDWCVSIILSGLFFIYHYRISVILSIAFLIIHLQ